MSRNHKKKLDKPISGTFIDAQGNRHGGDILSMEGPYIRWKGIFAPWDEKTPTELTFYSDTLNCLQSAEFGRLEVNQ